MYAKNAQFGESLANSHLGHSKKGHEKHVLIDKAETPLKDHKDGEWSILVKKGGSDFRAKGRLIKTMGDFTVGHSNDATVPEMKCALFPKPVATSRQPHCSIVVHICNSNCGPDGRLYYEPK